MDTIKHIKASIVMKAALSTLANVIDDGKSFQAKHKEARNLADANVTNQPDYWAKVGQ